MYHYHIFINIRTFFFQKLFWMLTRRSTIELKNNLLKNSRSLLPLPLGPISFSYSRLPRVDEKCFAWSHIVLQIVNTYIRPCTDINRETEFASVPRGRRPLGQIPLLHLVSLTERIPHATRTARTLNEDDNSNNNIFDRKDEDIKLAAHYGGSGRNSRKNTYCIHFNGSPH